ncbi:MAG TPA: hypothetical protein VL463_25705 [Kofleriaceae bacterium]|jgi:hypothetical protein|nr:hypothetical protein [Kofleriaceae bacterium]
MGVRFVPLCALLGVSACVETFSGSDVQIDFSSATPTAARNGTPQPNQPPQNTYYILYASQQETDDTGTVVKNYLFDALHFEIKPLIDTKSPCFIDTEGTRFPGLHVTEFANKVKEQTGITDPLNPPATATPGDISDVLDAQIRMGFLPALETQTKVVTDESDAQYGPSETTCIEDNAGADQTKFPPPNCTGEASNALRLKLCRAFWTANPHFYEGSDKVYMLPTAGFFRGLVNGTNPKNGSFIGGSEFLVDTVMTADAFVVTYQYKDLNGDGTPDYPDNLPDDVKKIGTVFMTGLPTHQARGVTNVQLVNAADGSINANMAIFNDVGNDGTNF